MKNAPPDACANCRQGREAFAKVIFAVKTNTIRYATAVRQSEKDKHVEELYALIDKQSNCGNPKCPNLKATPTGEKILYANRFLTGHFCHHGCFNGECRYI